MLKTVSVVVVAYILAHGLTALLVTPIQSRFLPEITAFASLVYLPHGVRVLTTWLLGRVAVVPIYLGAFLSEAIFTPGGFGTATQPVILVSILVGASSSLVAFEGMKLAGVNLYAGQSRRIHWSWLLFVGVLASLINSVGQVIVFSAAVHPEHYLAVLSICAVGDLIGLVITTLILMLLFRWMRQSPGRG
ncbi:hypothetical protein [Salipiger sp.]|uniref:hypothetical protein n=1 Tax=Salipiger sp. TaxID=2078585 RepID=UPI003A97E49F